MNAYNDPTPYRHKYAPKVLKMYQNVNVPLYSVYYDRDGKEYRFSYFGSRYFYCKKYEELAILTKDYGYLRQRLDQGYDGYPVDRPLLHHYMDESRPFGHELVLYSMLTIDEPEEFPWNVVYKSNKEKYYGIGI